MSPVDGRVVAMGLPSASSLMGIALVRAMAVCAYKFRLYIDTTALLAVGALFMPRTLSEPEKKQVAARQLWRCSSCELILSAAYQVDHTIALVDGGADTIFNATAMCANCHALKTQREAAHRAAAARTALLQLPTPTEAYGDRIDWYLSNTVVRCDACRNTRPAGTPHYLCPGLEDPKGEREAILLRRFAYVPRHLHTRY
jgi:hypothetical protein